jgi:hypothetical protein
MNRPPHVLAGCNLAFPQCSSSQLIDIVCLRIGSYKEARCEGSGIDTKSLKSSASYI